MGILATARRNVKARIREYQEEERIKRAAYKEARKKHLAKAAAMAGRRSAYAEFRPKKQTSDGWLGNLNRIYDEEIKPFTTPRKKSRKKSALERELGL